MFPPPPPPPQRAERSAEMASKRAQMNTDVGTVHGVLLLRIYGTLWCLHQLVPFVDALVRAAMRAAGADGIAVGFAAMDNRMLGAVDFYTRLPAVLLSLVALARLPKNEAAVVTLLSLAHIINIASWWYWMPRVWDSHFLSAIIPAGIVGQHIGWIRVHSMLRRVLFLK